MLRPWCANSGRTLCTLRSPVGADRRETGGHGARVGPTQNRGREKSTGSRRADSLAGSPGALDGPWACGPPAELHPRHPGHAQRGRIGAVLSREGRAVGQL